ncbi:MAG TPA: hypothetical protein VF077_12555 [Nitrospiraceae bacterium]
MKQIRQYTLTGVVPIMMHSGQLADPLNRWSKAIKAISGKRMKTEADHEEMARLEWFGSLYLDNGSPCIPGIAMQATLINASKTLKKGPKAKAGLLCETNFPLVYDGPADPQKLWLDERFRDRTAMVVQQARVMRTRPVFPEWSATIAIAFNDELLNIADVDAFVAIGGHTIGLLESRPRFGRYQSQVITN